MTRWCRIIFISRKDVSNVAGSETKRGAMGDGVVGCAMVLPETDDVAGYGGRVVAVKCIYSIFTVSCVSKTCHPGVSWLWVLAEVFCTCIVVLYLTPVQKPTNSGACVGRLHNLELDLTCAFTLYHHGETLVRCW